ncbi:MAG TPA: hypothetical protein VKQ32_24055 [Polyangia bacterium]|nr:hypothetical protein [Polyangia bacterium]
MKTTTKNTGIKVTTGVKAGGLRPPNHNRTALRVKSGLQAGSCIYHLNHNRSFVPGV